MQSMQKFNPKEVQLKNGKLVMIRQAEVADAEKLLNCIRTYIPESEFIPKLAEEIKLTVEQERDLIYKFMNEENSILLVAEHKGQIIGNIDLTGSQRIIMRHTGVIGMGMIKEWTNAGLGTALLASVIDWAMENPILELIWLQAYTANELGINLYKKMGFVETGVMKNFFKHGDRYYDDITMFLSVK